MAKVSKFMKISQDILMEWIFDDEHYFSENYKVITNLNEDIKRSFLSTQTNNNIRNNLFQLDPILKKYTQFDTSKYNFLQEQDYNTPPIPYDRARIYLPTSYNFAFHDYIGFYLKIYTYDYYNEKLYDLSNVFFDYTIATSSGLTGLTLCIPFIYDEQEWGKYYEIEVPSVNYVSNQRYVSETGNTVWENSVNDNLTLGVGLSQNSPIFLDFHYLYSKEIVLGTTYYYAAETYRSSFPQAPEYNTLGVQIEESSEGDFFEFYGTYGESNENLDNFVREMYNKGRRIRIEYDVYLYEENIQTNKQTFVVSEESNDDFTKKLTYRPVLTFSNTTAAIKVVMRVIDLVDISTISRTTTLGISDNIQKYGKRLISLNVQNLNRLKIYNAKPDEIILGRDYFSGNLTSEIIKVNYPQLIEVGKIIVNSPKSSSEYKGMGLLNLVITPFDNIIQFRLALVPQTNSGLANQLEKYDLSAILNNSELLLVFKSDNESVSKSIYNEADNDYKNGIINFKIIENDLKVLRTIYNKGYNNFYLTIISNNIKTLLYSGTFSFLEDIKFVDTNSSYILDTNDTVSPVDTGTGGGSGGSGSGGTGTGTGGTGTGTGGTGTGGTGTGDSSDYSEWPKPGRTLIIYTKYKSST